MRYISTRKSVEECKKNFSVTFAQKDLIRQLLKNMPEVKDMLEYENYHQRPTIGNALEFITKALERNLDMAAIAFVIYYYGRSFPEAVSMLLGGEQGETYQQSILIFTTWICSVKIRMTS